MAFTHPRLEVVRFVYPGPIALQAIEAKPSVRAFALSDLPPTKVCHWCNAHPITPPKRKYCSEDCTRSAYLFCYPQNPATKMYVFLQLQDCVCVGCGECFDDQVRELVEGHWSLLERRKADPSWAKYVEGVNHVSLATLGDGTGHRWQVDHIIPIFRGGRGVCIENIQVLCEPCHRKKTARERRTP